MARGLALQVARVEMLVERPAGQALEAFAHPLAGRAPGRQPFVIRSAPIGMPAPRRRAVVARTPGDAASLALAAASSLSPLSSPLTSSHAARASASQRICIAASTWFWS